MSGLEVFDSRRGSKVPTRAIGGGFSWRKVLLLWLPASLIAALVVLPVPYLIMRAAEGGEDGLRLVLRAHTATILINTLLLATAVTFASATLATAFAWLTTRTDLPLRRIWSVLSALPLVIPSYVGAYLFVAAFGPRGLLQDALELRLGISRLPDVHGFAGAFIVLTLLSYPYVMLPVRAALRRMDPALEESAQSLGLRPSRAFARVILPQLRPALIAGSLLVALYVIRDFGAVSIMRYTTFTRAIYVQYQSAFDRSGAAILSLVLVLITLVLSGAALKGRRSPASYRIEGGARPGLPPIALKRWTAPALLLCALVVSLALVVPAAVLTHWLLRALEQGPAWLTTLGAAWNSLSVSMLAALLTVAASLPVALLTARSTGPASQWLEGLSYLGFALPGVVVALALVFFGIRAAPGLYQTLPLLLLAYVILFLPQAVGSMRTTLAQIPTGLEEAARSLGRGPVVVFLRVTAPLLRPGVLASAALVFLTCMKELQATLLLGPLGFRSLSTQIWSSVSEAFFAQAAAPSLILILAASVPMAYFVTQEGQ